MAVQNLNEVQRRFVAETIRPAIEEVIRFRDRMNSLVLEIDNQQVPIANTIDELGDGTGTASRTDAPILTGQHVSQLRTFAGNMRDQITANQLNALIALSVRDLNTVLRG